MKRDHFFLFSCVVWTINFFIYTYGINNKDVWIIEDAGIMGIPVHYKCIYSWYVFVLGYYLKKNTKTIVQPRKQYQLWLFAIFSFIMFYGFKFILNKKIFPMSSQIICQPLTVICVLYIFLAFIKLDMNLKYEGTKVGSWINSISCLTLESYLVQFLIIAGIQSLKIVFPMNYMVSIIAILCAAWLLHFFDQKIIIGVNSFLNIFW